MSRILPVITLLAGLVAGLLLAPDNSGGADSEPASPSVAAKKPVGEAVVRNFIKTAMPDYVIVKIQQAEVGGFHEVYFENGQILMVDGAGEFLMGSVFGLVDGNLNDLLADKRQQFLLTLLEREHEAGRTVNFTPEKGSGRWLAVFTDPACGYCRKLHNEIEEYKAMGIEVRYLAMPTVGGQRSLDSMITAWCSKDPALAMHALKTGGTIAEVKGCNSEPDLRRQALLASAFGFRGTPGIVLDDGRTIPGFRPAKDLAIAMGVRAADGS